MEKEYSYSFNGENFTGDFKTAEEALEKAKELSPNKSVIFIGENAPLFKPTIFSENIIDTLREQAYDEVGVSADAYLDSVKVRDAEKLTKLLTDTFNEWAKSTGNTPYFHKVINIKKSTP